MMARILGSTLVAGAGLGVLAPPALAQISPGKLSRGHAALEGSTQCLRCHDAKRGLAADKCFACHRPLQERAAAGKGLHARGEYRDCKTCHVEHQGVEFELVWWGKAGREAFDHRQVGYALVGKHASLACQACHQPRFVQGKDALAAAGSNPARTYLGLGAACIACHVDEHRGQFTGRDCLSCHGQAAWKPAPGFDHSRSAYPLTGRHSGVACEKCHSATLPDPTSPGKSYRRYKPLASRDCTSCHQDVHRGRFGASCTDCHSTASWQTVVARKAFDHDRTVYPLRGRHTSVACEKCHAQGRPLKMKHERCEDCHADAHLGQLARRADRGRCETCHDVSGFAPARFAADDHQKTAYPLAGAHLAVACDACHHAATAEALRRLPGLQVTGGAGRRTAQFRFASTRCTDCHRDPHRGEVDKQVRKAGCEACHRVESWRRFSFDHAQTRFVLAGGHARPACAACHKKVEVGTPRERVQLAGLPLNCEACHADPHRGQFTREGAALACDRCHTTDTVQASRFDHKRDSAYALDGAHARIACAACHRKEKKEGVVFVRYKPLPTTCKGCHGPSGAPAKRGAR